MVFLENCKKAEVFGDSNNFLCEAAVSLGPLGSILVAVPRSMDYKAQENFTLVFYDPVMGKLTCRCALSAPLPLPDQMCSLRCQVLEQLAQEQRREDVKVPVIVRMMLHVSRQPGDSVYVPPEGWPATVQNISAGGVYLQTDLPLVLRLEARILRVDDLTKRPNQPLYGYGCKFINLSARSENQLRNYVFREEKRQRKR